MVVVYLSLLRISQTSQLNWLMLPAIFLSSLATLGSIALDQISWSPYVVSSLNAFISFIGECVKSISGHMRRVT